MSEQEKEKDNYIIQVVSEESLGVLVPHPDVTYETMDAMGFADWSDGYLFNIWRLNNVTKSFSEEYTAKLEKKLIDLYDESKELYDETIG